MMTDMKRKFGGIVSVLLATAGLGAAIVGQPASTNAQTNGPRCVTNVKRGDMEDLIRRTGSADTKSINDLILEVRRLFGSSCQATKDGLANDEKTKSSLKYGEIELTASEYDGVKRKSTPDAVPYSWITAGQVAEFYDQAPNAAEFDNFFRFATNGAPITDVAAVGKARELFARIMLAYAESKTNGEKLEPGFGERVGWAVAFQQSLTLAQIYLSTKINPQVVVTDAQVDLALKTNPEFSTASKRLKAAGILRRVLAGEDFAKLATQFSEDPGSKAQGGLYQSISKGAFEKHFEDAALGVKPGETVRTLVETPFGFHIIRLEKINGEGGAVASYDVRHILISTMMGSGDERLPLRDYARGKLITKRRDALLAAVVLKNPVTIDYKIPVVKAVPKRPVKTPAKGVR